MTPRIVPRFLVRFVAFLLGYFYLPCPMCGEDFAGFETSRRVHMPMGSGRGYCVCSRPECEQMTIVRNERMRFPL